MKKLICLGMGLILCLSAAVWTGCDKEKESEQEKEYAEIQILDARDNEITDLDLRQTRAFMLKNNGNVVIGWEIPDLSEAWISFGKQSGELASGATERIELIVDWGKLLDGENVATVVVKSPFGDKRLTVRAIMYFSVGADYEETAFGMELKMVAVTGGTFMMGATEEQGEYVGDDEKPVHEVTLDGYYIGKYEVTQAQWEAVMGMTIAQKRDEVCPECPVYGSGKDCPMYYVRWKDAVAFCEKLSSRTGKKYRLPTEAEWEYAARGGQQADGTRYSGSSSVDEVAWYDCRPKAVGGKRPNGLGLYDMSGNIREWCSDWYDAKYYSKSEAVNPSGSSNFQYRVCRGGSWDDYEGDCRVSKRGIYVGNSYYSLGFRVVCER